MTAMHQKYHPLSCPIQTCTRSLAVGPTG